MLNITTEDLLLYYYQETTEDQAITIEKALKSDWELQKKYEELKESISQLDSFAISPRKEAIQSVMEYAKKTTEPISI
jgi:hypothetical protein